MSIQKKSLISTLKTAKKANVASTGGHEVDAKGSKIASMRLTSARQAITAKTGSSLKTTMKSTKLSAKTLTSSRAATTKAV
jgi:hypothetical protein